MGGPMMRTSKREDHAALTRRRDSGDAMGRGGGNSIEVQDRSPYCVATAKKNIQAAGAAAACCADISAGLNAGNISTSKEKSRSMPSLPEIRWL